jgi:hypothetical protein
MVPGGHWEFPIRLIDSTGRLSCFAISKTAALTISSALQVIGRLASHLPVTPLEAHTTVHVACTVLLYVVWLNKPYNLCRSILLEDAGVKDMAALAYFHELTGT